MIQTAMNYINTLSDGNQMVAGALTLTLSGAALVLLRTAPRTIWDMLKRNFSTTMTFNNGEWGKRRLFTNIMNYLHDHTTENSSRTLTFDTYWDGEQHTAVLTMGKGNHFFFYKGRLLILNRQELESSGSEIQKEQVTLTVLGRSHSIFKEILKENTPEVTNHLLNISEYRDCWDIVMRTRKVPLGELALNPETKDLLVREIEYFENSEDQYRRQGLPYKLTMLLHGLTGSGKSSVIRSLASTYNKTICEMNIGEFNDKTFRNALRSVPKNSIVTIEDFDSASATKTRTGVSDGVHESSKGTDAEDIKMDDWSGLTLSGILNSLDGVASLDGVIIVLTTNVRDAIDPALLRSGRIDTTIELPLIRAEVVRQHFEDMYPGLKETNIAYADTRACDINRIKSLAKGDLSLLREELDTRTALRGVS